METVLPMKKIRRKRRRRAESNQVIQADVMLKLYELLQGERETVKVYSNALNSEIYFVNSEEQSHSADVPPDVPVYTARELSFVMSLSSEELRRYHYLKMKLV